MTSSLSAPDLKALRAVNDALLDPLSHDTTDEWLLEVCSRFEALCHASTSFAGYSFVTGDAGFVSRDIPKSYLDRLSELSLLEPGSLRSNDDCVEKVMGDMRQLGSSVALSTDLIDPAGPARIPPAELMETPIFRDVACPLGVPGSALLFHSGGAGEFMVHAAFPEIEYRPFGEVTRQVLSVLLPGFAASMGALARIGNARHAIAVLLDGLEDGAAVFDSTGSRMLARNRTMERLSREEPDTEALERAVRQSAAAGTWNSPNPSSDPPSNSQTALSRGWSSGAGNSYRLRAIRLPAGSVTPKEAVLVLVQRIGPSVPDTAELMGKYRLTRRESEVARRLAYGRSDREIATELGLSPHTVRHHAESVFVKLGVTSRKALALHLSSLPR